MITIICKSNQSSPDFFLIEGLASTNARDSFDEVINQGGIDLSLVEGETVHLNIEHGDDFPLYELSVVGIITEAKITKDTDPALVGTQVSGTSKHVQNTWLNYKIDNGALNGVGLS